MTQTFNPYLPSYEYIPDAEPYVFGDRVYIYGSHDCFDGKVYCQNDYVCWSAPIDDLGAWRYEGVIYRKRQDPRNSNGAHCLYAPDVQCGADGRYYLYYALDSVGVMSVAVCDTPAGTYQYYGDVHFPCGHILGERQGDIFNFDPGVLVDDDGRVYLYSGFAPRYEGKKEADGLLHEGAYWMELEPDMLTIRRGPSLLLPRAGKAEGTGFEGHEFFEASSLRKIGSRYYFIYSSINGHELCYAVSDRPDGGFRYGGTLISNGDIDLNGRAPKDAVNYTGNNHGSIVPIKDQWYVFYHRQTNLHQYSRQACAEKITICKDGSIPQTELTSCGLNKGPLAGKGVYEARIACQLYSKKGAFHYVYNEKAVAGIHPYLTQDGADREDDPNQHIANFREGSVAGYKYFRFTDSTVISVKVRGNASGTLNVYQDLSSAPAARIDIGPAASWASYGAPLKAESGVSALYFRFEGEGAFDFLSFELA